MKDRYTRECPRPEYDKQITEWVNANGDDFGMMGYPVAIYHDGFIYRVLTGSGLGEYAAIRGFLGQLGLVNLIDDTASFRGYDAVYASQQIKSEVISGILRMCDIPRNTPPAK